MSTVFLIKNTLKVKINVWSSYLIKGGIIMYREIDERAAYNKNSPIRTAEQIGAKLKTIPMDAGWVEHIKKEHWYHENREITEYVKCDAEHGHKMLDLRDKLLTFGGQEVCMPCYEEDLMKILERGQLWLGDRITMKRGLPSQCHFNSCRCWDANKDKVVLCTGYALSEDGCWRQHSWCVHIKPRKNRVVETTVERIAYFGFVMTEEEANQFYYDND